MRRLAFLFALALPACGKAPVDVPLAVPAAPSAEEEVVRRYVQDGAADPKSVAFEQWGPHESGDDLWAACSRHGEPGPSLPPYPPPGAAGPVPAVDFAALLPGSRVVRVRYHTTLPLSGPEPHDELFVVKDARVGARMPNPCGDDWLKGVEASLAESAENKRRLKTEFSRRLRAPEVPAPAPPPPPVR